MVRLARRWDGLAVVRKRLRKEGGNWIREPDSKEKDPVDGGDSDQAEDSGPPLNADCLKYNDTILWEMFHCWGFKPKPTVDKIKAEVNALFEISEHRPHPKQAYKDAWTLKRLWGYAQRRQRDAGTRLLFAKIKEVREQQHGFGCRFIKSPARDQLQEEGEEPHDHPHAHEDRLDGKEAETDPYQSGADLAPCEDSNKSAAEDEDLEVMSFVPAPKSNSKVHELQMELINLQREISKRLSKGGPQASLAKGTPVHVEEVETQPYDHSIAVVPDSPNPIAVGNPEKRHYLAGPIFSRTMQEARARASKEDPAAPRAYALPSHSGSPPEPTEELPDVNPQKQRDLRRAAKDAAEEKKSGKKDKEVAKTKKKAVKETKKKKAQEEKRPQAKKKKEKKQPELTNGNEDEEEEEEEGEDEEEEELQEDQEVEEEEEQPAKNGKGVAKKKKNENVKNKNEKEEERSSKVTKKKKDDDKDAEQPAKGKVAKGKKKESQKADEEEEEEEVKGNGKTAAIKALKEEGRGGGATKGSQEEK
ncbi:unnamed protein product [Durusdinium trenchii]|uniref:Nucleolar protein 16 n=1 Tax=Durusdinium trenchii TaxID=1381693 RepID=A0ABP0KT74_9DINO